MKLSKNGYLIIGGIVILSGVLLVVAKTTTTLRNQPQNNLPINLTKLNNGTRQTQSATPLTTDQNNQANATNQQAVDMGKAIESKLKGQFPDNPDGDIRGIGGVSVTQDVGGGYDVQVDYNEGGATSDAIDMAHIYIAIYKDKTMNIQNVSITAHHPPTQDQYGKPVNSPGITTSLDKNEASKYNWSLDDLNLALLMWQHINPQIPTPQVPQ